MPSPVCLIVDDEPSIRKTLALTMEAEAWTARACSTVEEALKVAGEVALDLALVDLRLGTGSGLDLLPRLLELQPGLPVVMITAYSSIATAVEAMRRGATDYLPKPFLPEDVRQAARQAMGERRAERSRSEALAGPLLDSRVPAMQELMAEARRAAAAEAPILLAGEAGTGKGALARALHAWSPRAAKPFNLLASPGLPEQLLASELFGHAVGAFAGAYRELPGRLALSEGGTLFLDEVTDLPLALQDELLGFLDEGVYRRRGESQARRADVRLIAATHQDLGRASAEGRFQAALSQRLGAVVLTVPALRQRLLDLPRLGQAILDELGAALDRPRLRLGEEALAALLDHAWPGNLRELRSVLERAAVIAESEEIQKGDLRLSVVPAGEVDASLSLERMEEAHIRRVLRISPTLDRAARILGVDNATLWRKRKKYRL